ncbi:MAG TPA: undecaprenyl-diphosphate phosphatase [Terriglobales bacterium]|jgi:undecaprenyl-diphosphatase|nr:undecaprenyl-diphosphate phosphatase [Terriglobales bacterium]
MSLVHVIVLAIVQGLTELLPVSSSAHVVVAEKLMGMDPSSPETTLLLVMLHTGTMFAVILYFWQQWRAAFFQSGPAFKRFALLVVLATGITGVVGGTLIKIIEGVFFQNAAKAEIEQLFGHLELIAPALGVAGVLILIAGFAERRAALRASPGGSGLGLKQAGWIGAVQGLCLPFRGFSRSGATISAGVLAGVSKARSEEFSFALAVVLTPPAIIREVLRLIEAQRMSGSAGLGTAILPCLVGGLCAFLAGLLALKWLSRWLQTGRWHLFGIYCLIAAAAVAILHRSGY